MELWLNLNLGSLDRPERWLSKLELSILTGVALAAGTFFVPKVAGISLFAVLGALFVYLFIF
jgi:hypothetical protein